MTRDADAVAAMFRDGAVLAAGQEGGEARGADQIGRTATALWRGERTYVADPRRVVQARDTALVVTSRGVNVVRRDDDGCWRYAIALLSLEPTIDQEEQR